MSGHWTLIESDPGVFSQLITKMGVRGVQVEELYSLDQPFEELSPVYGLIFLFKYVQASAGGDAGASVAVDYRHDEPGLFFAQQVITNACATQAILSILMNTAAEASNSDKSVTLGEELTQFRDFTSELPADMKGLAISNSDTIRLVHNSFARNQMFAMDESAARDDDDEDLFHFVAYIPHNGCVFELDGLKPAPICHGPIADANDWIASVKPVIQQRIAHYAFGEIRFNLMAVIKDRRVVYDERLKMIEARLGDTAVSDAEKEQLKRERANLREKHAAEGAKRDRFMKENARRQHNFLPLIFKLLDGMAEKGILKDKFKI